MNLIKWLAIFSLSSLVVFIQILTYKNISSKKELKLSLFKILIIIISGIIIGYSSYSIDSILKAFISYFTLIMVEYFIFKDNLNKTITSGTFCYILVVISEIILSIIVLKSNFVNLNTIDNNILYKILFSLLMTLPVYLLCKLNVFEKIYNKIIKILEKTVKPILLFIILLIIVINIAFKNAENLSVATYVSSLTLLIIFFALFIFTFYNDMKAAKEVENTKVLLDFMADYEKKIDEDRVIKHEMLNNLLILKSYENKNSKKYNDTLDDIINIYSRKNTGVKNIYKLPSGLKGIIYYKINEVKDKDVNININISKQLSSLLENLDYKTYAVVCKIVGITFDNAIEAALNSKEKNIVFDVYDEEDKIVIDIENTFKKKVNVNKISKKNYSTKGKNRGLGLYIAKILIRSNKSIKMDQSIDKNIFITKIYINKNLDNV